MAVAGNAGVGGYASAMFLDKEIDHILFEDFLYIDEIEGHVELVGHLAGIVDALQATTFVGRAFASTNFGPQPHHHANAVIALFHEQGRGYRAIDAAAHGNDDGGLLW